MFKSLAAVVGSIYIIGVLCQEAELPVAPSCLGCICEASSGCNTTTLCSEDVCGPFSITRPYWMDANQPTVNQQSPNEASAFANCVEDIYCAAITVQGYMLKYKQDCNNDGRIDCDDFVAIHRLGDDDCKNPLPENFALRYQHCKKVVGNVRG